MKRLRVISALAIVLVLFLTACSHMPATETQPPTSPGGILKGKIAQMYDASCLIAGSGSSDLYTVPTALDIYDENNKSTDASSLKAGQAVEIGYSGNITESYPAQLYEPTYIRITGQGDNLIGFYQTILSDLWNVDDGLNPDAGVLAFDLSQVTNLTDAEKSALVYTVSNSHGLEGITGTFDELSERGYINKEKLLFENGMLFELKLTDVNENGFTFDVTKWRSGTGAYFFCDCKAVKSGDIWSYTIGSEAIS